MALNTCSQAFAGASGYQHYRFGNVNKKLFRVLLLPGVAGPIAGAMLLTHFGDTYANYIQPILAVYLLLLGLRIISKAVRKQRNERRKVKNAGWPGPAASSTRSAAAGGDH